MQHLWMVDDPRGEKQPERDQGAGLLLQLLPPPSVMAHCSCPYSYPHPCLCQGLELAQLGQQDHLGNTDTECEPCEPETSDGGLSVLGACAAVTPRRTDSNKRKSRSGTETDIGGLGMGSEGE